MDIVNNYNDLFESIPDYRKIVFIMFSIEDGKKLIKEVGFIKNGIIQLSLEFKNILLEVYKQYLNYVKKKISKKINGTILLKFVRR